MSLFDSEINVLKTGPSVGEAHIRIFLENGDFAAWGKTRLTPSCLGLEPRVVKVAKCTVN